MCGFLTPVLNFIYAHPAKVINSAGLLFDIAGAWFVAWEVVNQYKGHKVNPNPLFDDLQGEETPEFKQWEKRKLTIMSLGLGSLTIGFILQIISNFI
jgi:hypothetical protein